MSSSTSADHSNKRQRSRNGCLTCRRRRVKCDEAPGVCSNCRNFGIQCEWATSASGHHILFTPHHVNVVSGNPARRPACDACRSAKTKCDRDVPSCLRCRQDGLECAYSHKRRRPGQSSRDATSAEDQRTDQNGSSFIPTSNFAGSSQTGQLANGSMKDASSIRHTFDKEDKLYSRADLTQLLDAFFRHVHPEMAMSFIHRGQLYRRLEDGWASGKGSAARGTSPLLLKCMAAASARFLDSADASHPDGGALPEQWAKEAKMAITLELDRFSSTKLAATLCIIHHEYCSGRIGSAWTWTALATRMCVGMSLHLGSQSSTSVPEDSTDSWIAAEGRRRLVWATVCADAWSACGLSECTTFDRRLVDHLALPSTERDFTFGHNTVSSHPPAMLSHELEYGQLKGISANHIWLTMLGSDVQWYLKHISDNTRPWELESSFHLLQKRLDNWIASCGPDIQFNVSNMYARKDDTDFGAWLHVHLHSDQIGFVLRCFTMPGYEDNLPSGYLEDVPPGWIDETREECARYARRLAEKIHAVTQRFPDFIPANWTWNIFAYGSVREQLSFASLQDGHTGLSGTNQSGLGGGTAMENGLQAMIFLLYRMTIWFDQNHRIARDMLRMVMNQGIYLQAEWIGQLRSRMSGEMSPGQVKSPVLSRMPFLRRYIRHPEMDESGDKDDAGPEIADARHTGSTGRNLPSSNARQMWAEPSGGTRSSHSFQTLLNSQVETSPETDTTRRASRPTSSMALKDLPDFSSALAPEPTLGFDLFDILNDPSYLTSAAPSHSDGPAHTLPWQQAPHFGIMGNDNSYLSFLDMETLSGMMPLSDDLDQHNRNQA